MFRIYDPCTDKLLAEAAGKEEAIRKAREVEPEGTLVGEYTHLDGKTSGFFVGPVKF